tara:strand:- start:501 stop:719 length:219 start_codon:yes stop_codon:yes gene_type:complete
MKTKNNNCILCNCETHINKKDKFDVDINKYCKYLGFCPTCYKKLEKKERKKIEWSKILNNYFDLRDFEKEGG